MDEYTDDIGRLEHVKKELVEIPAYEEALVLSTIPLYPDPLSDRQIYGKCFEKSYMKKYYYRRG